MWISWGDANSNKHIGCSNNEPDNFGLLTYLKSVQIDEEWKNDFIEKFWITVSF